ncbi:hypothetical protein A9Q94_19470, partial [Rhodobacterales bacterium 56_14_T64]
YLVFFIKISSVILAEKILLSHPLSSGGDYRYAPVPCGTFHYLGRTYLDETVSGRPRAVKPLRIAVRNPFSVALDLSASGDFVIV